MAKKIDVQALTLSMIRESYSGKSGCMCGCKGRYSSAKERPLAAKRMLTKIQTAHRTDPSAVEVDSSGEWVSIETNGRIACLYLEAVSQ